MASEKITKLLEEIKTLSVMELFELEKGIEEEFGVSAAAAVVAAPAGGAAASDAAAEQTEFTVMLKSAGAAKIAVIKDVQSQLRNRMNCVSLKEKPFFISHSVS